MAEAPGRPNCAVSAILWLACAPEVLPATRTPYGAVVFVKTTAVGVAGLLSVFEPMPLKNVTPKLEAVVTPLMDCEVINVLLLGEVTTFRLERSLERSHLWVVLQAPPLPSVN